jgi:tRNA modification GTPase
MSLATIHDTITAVSTPLGTSALATIRLSGADAIGIASRCIDSADRLFTTIGGGSFYTNVIDADGTHIDDVVVTVWRAPRSYTGEDTVEFHTHGSPVIADLVQRLCIASGARLAEPGEFSRRAFIHGKLGLEELERTVLRLGASSKESLTKVESLLNAKFTRLRDVYEQIIALLAQVNAEIDFGESDIVKLSNFESQLDSIGTSLDEFLARSINELENKGYYSVALTGPPNVGKSSIFNALLRYERSIVSDVPGTTRDYVEAFVMFEGFRVKIIDTAGLRSAQDLIESKGIALGSAVAEKADVVLRITDPQTRSTLALQDEYVVHNKADLDGYSTGITFSAITRQGLDTLIGFIKEKVSALDSARTNYQIGESEATIIGTARKRCGKSLLNKEITIAAEELRSAADSIAGLFGMNVSEDSLEYIFHKMCIGK